MPFVNRHKKSEIQSDPNLRFVDYDITIKSCKRLRRAPSTICSYAEGTRFTKKKHSLQKSPYKNLLVPKIGGLATALSALPEVKFLIDFTVVYKGDKRSAWSFLKGDMADVKVKVKKHVIPEHLKIRIIYKELIRFNNHLTSGPPRFLPTRSSSSRGLPPPLRGGNSSSKESPALPIPSYPALCREDTTSWKHGRPRIHYEY